MPASASDDRPIYIGLMSGTSMDGIDATAVDFGHSPPLLLGHIHLTWPDSLQHSLKRLAQPGENEIDQLGVIDLEVADQFSHAVECLLESSGLKRSRIKAIGSHGQTIRHRPNAPLPFTLQIGDPNRLAENTGITVVADFRRRDMAAGGEGAPLAPAFHSALFQTDQEERVVLNLGGIANITRLPGDRQSPVIGFDTGPANTLMDHWIQQHQGLPFDRSGRWAASGNPIPGLLTQLLDDPYFRADAPKSTGPEYFNLKWAETRDPHLFDYRPADVQSTFLSLTCTSIAQAIRQHAPDCKRLICCGGGAHNSALMQRLDSELPQATVESVSAHGFDPEHIEAIAFAWLACQTLHGLTGNLPQVTGAAHPVILGGIYQA